MDGKRVDGPARPNAAWEPRFLVPFRLSLDPMERLLVVSFRDDPEFTMLEPQSFDDPQNGTGVRVLRYRRDGRVDVYWQPGVRVDRDGIAIGAGIADFAEVTFEAARFDITAEGVQVDIAFTDLQGRRVELRIAESPAGGSRFPFLAPVGNEVEEPRRLFLAYMLEFDFVRRAGTRLRAGIGDRELRPEGFPLPRGGRRVWFARYSALPVVAALNPDGATPAQFELARPGRAEVDGMVVEVDEAGRTTRLHVGAGRRSAGLDFGPGLPRLLAMEDGASAGGRWSFRVAETVVTGGSYRLARSGDSIEVELDVTDPWQPVDLPLAFRAFTAVARSFRRWPTTYRWRGAVGLRGAPTLTGAWERTGRRTA